jgi:hypothetical protein
MMTSRKPASNATNAQSPAQRALPPTPRRQAQARNAVGQTAQAGAGQGSTTQQSSDWFAERIESPHGQAASERDANVGVPLSPSPQKATGIGQAVESRRGSHR